MCYTRQNQTRSARETQRHAASFLDGGLLPICSVVNVSILFALRLRGHPVADQRVHPLHTTHTMLRYVTLEAMLKCS